MEELKILQRAREELKSNTVTSINYQELSKDDLIITCQFFEETLDETQGMFEEVVDAWITLNEICEEKDRQLKTLIALLKEGEMQ